jgi:uncharacterized protein YqeY
MIEIPNSMERAPQQKFTNPDEEIAFLKAEIAKREQELLARSPEADRTDLESVARQELRDYEGYQPEVVLDQSQKLAPEAMAAAVSQVEAAGDKVGEIVSLAEREGIKNALTVMEKANDAHLTDEVHRQLIELIRSGRTVQQLKEGVPPWQVLHMTLFEVALPEPEEEQGKEKTVQELIGVMEQFYAGMQAVVGERGLGHLVIEIAVEDESDDIALYVAVPNQFADLFEKQLFSLYPFATLTERTHDYNIFVPGGTALAAEVKLAKHPIYPLRPVDEFASDPLMVLLNAFSKIERDGGGAAVQVVMRPVGQQYNSTYQKIAKQVRDGMKVGEAISRSTLSGEILAGARELFASNKKKEDNTPQSFDTPDTDTLELFNQKLTSPIVATNVRLAVSAREAHRAEQIITELEATFNQLEHARGNRLTFTRATGGTLKKLLKAYSFREFVKGKALPLSLRELSLLMHFPANGVVSSPAFKQVTAQTAPAPATLPADGTLLGVNDHRGVTKDIYLTEADRLRHFYIIGQTGTGKSAFMKNLIVQDIQAGHGVCMIDPHGSDLQDVLGSVPSERADDVIYFDPSNLNEVIGLNMLEYDPRFPEQKTFVVNELFSIFQRLYGANPESMGPMFEQYFRNATLLVMEDPASGNTLMDISRVMSDANYRRQKLAKATNPVVTQFWQEIATKAGGEASLENIVPYIVSKFDVFTANDYMRPIIGQQQSSFNFRQLMDERKILLVNLSKGRLGEINANLIGMIVVGKILMAALSRVDDPSQSFPPFFLHIDEFQNVTTDSIASILSEARKYKLSLTVAHQFIAQLDERIRDAVFGNVGSLAAFRVGSEDAQFLESQFTPVFGAHDLMNIPNYQAYVRLLADGTPTKPFSLATLPPQKPELSQIDAMRATSTSRYARPRSEVEAEIAARYQQSPR